MGQPMEHVLRQCLIALDLADRVGLGADDREAVFFGSLVAWVGCHVDAYEQAKWFGDETVLKGDFRRTDFHTAASGPLFMMRHLGNGLAWHQKLGLIPSFMGEGKRAAESHAREPLAGRRRPHGRAGSRRRRAGHGRAELRALGRPRHPQRSEGR